MSVGFGGGGAAPAVRLACSPVGADAFLGPFRTHVFGYLFGKMLRDQGGKIYIRCDDTNKDKGDDEHFHWFYHFAQTRGHEI
jgi:glutamyl/glutaminyl-tRNA synthetase